MLSYKIGILSQVCIKICQPNFCMSSYHLTQTKCGIPVLMRKLPRMMMRMLMLTRVAIAGWDVRSVRRSCQAEELDQHQDWGKWRSYILQLILNRIRNKLEAFGQILSSCLLPNTSNKASLGSPSRTFERACTQALVAFDFLVWTIDLRKWKKAWPHHKQIEWRNYILQLNFGIGNNLEAFGHNSLSCLF